MNAGKKAFFCLFVDVLRALTIKFSHTFQKKKRSRFGLLTRYGIFFLCFCVFCDVYCTSFPTSAFSRWPGHRTDRLRPTSLETCQLSKAFAAAAAVAAHRCTLHCRTLMFDHGGGCGVDGDGAPLLLFPSTHPLGGMTAEERSVLAAQALEWTLHLAAVGGVQCERLASLH